MRAPGLAMLLWLGAVAVAAGTVEQSTVTHQGRRYALKFVAQVNAPPERVYAILSDFGRVARLSDTIVEAELLPEPQPGTVRRRLLMRSCILFYCFRVRMVEDIEQPGDYRLLTTVVPDDSDFADGRTEWRMSATDGGTRIELDSEQQPTFWIPPLIGSWIIERRMQREAQRVVARIEKLARE
jgi:hypothetical protein